MSAPDDHSVTFVIADDHEVVREGLRRVLEQRDDWTIVAEAATADEALRYVRGHRPDVLVLDLNMPGSTPSLELIPLLADEAPETRVVVLTMQDEPAFVRGALAAGASAYVLKEAAGAELLDAVATARAGDVYLNPRLGARLVGSGPGGGGPPDGLSSREVEVLGLLAAGHTNTEIAEKLFLSVRTIETHRTHIQRKTKRSTRAELFAYASERGLVAPPQRL